MISCEHQRTTVNEKMAEREGFEPSIRFCRILTFQASAFDHSATAPHALEEAPSKGRITFGQGCRKCRASLVPCAMTPDERLRGRLPTAEDIDAIARRTLERLPSPFRESLGEVVLSIEDIADLDTARHLDLQHPMQLSGLYEGVSLNRRSVSESGTLPERVTLYVRPIIAEWRSTPFSLDQIVSHIVIHEIGHHFGFSDEDMHALEDGAE